MQAEQSGLGLGGPSALYGKAQRGCSAPCRGRKAPVKVTAAWEPLPSWLPFSPRIIMHPEVCAHVRAQYGVTPGPIMRPSIFMLLKADCQGEGGSTGGVSQAGWNGVSSCLLDKANS